MPHDDPMEFYAAERRKHMDHLARIRRREILGIVAICIAAFFAFFGPEIFWLFR